MKQQERTTIVLFLFLSFSLFLHGCALDKNKQAIESWHRLRATGEIALVKRDYAAAAKSFQEALIKGESVPEQPVRAAVSLEDLSRLYLATNNVQKASTICDRALALANQRTKAPPKQMDVLNASLGQCLNNVAQVLAQAKKYDQAAIAYREARALFTDLYKHTPLIGANQIVDSYLAVSIDGLGSSYKELGQLKEARQAYWSVKDNGIIAGLSMPAREKLVEDYVQIPDTTKEDKEKFAALLGCSVPYN